MEAVSTSSLEENKIVAGIAALILFLSAKYLLADIHGCFGTILESKYIKYVALLSAVFLNTKSFKVSLLVASIYFIIRDVYLDVLMPETNGDCNTKGNHIW